MAHDSVAVEYREVPGFPLYRVGSDGTIWSRNRKGRSKPGRIWGLMDCKPHSRGYKQVHLFNRGVRSIRFVHRLVLEVFVGPCPKGMEACHFPNPDKTCNEVSNLRWDTPVENFNDNVKLGRLPSVVLHPESEGFDWMPTRKITPAIAKAIREEFTNDPRLTVGMLGRKYEMSDQNISDILRGNTWKTAGGPIVHNIRRPRRRCA